MIIFDDSFYNLVIEQEIIDSAQLFLTRGFKAIKAHQDLTNSEFSLLALKQALEGEDDRGYGLKGLQTNIPKIKVLYEKLAADFGWIDWVEKELLNYFSTHYLENIYISPVIGYDAGIGINDTVCVNLNFKPFLDNYKECIAVVLHEGVHVAFSRKHGIYLKLDSRSEIIKSLQYLIQYEGVAIYIARRYREDNDLLSLNGNPLREDYHVSYNDYCDLFSLYEDVLKAKSKEEAFQLAFTVEKLAHKLGYYLVENYAENKGIDGVKEIVNMSTIDYTNKFLNKRMY